MLAFFMVFVIPFSHVPDLLFRYGPIHKILTSSLINDSDYDGSGHKWELNNDKRLVTILVHYCTDSNIFISHKFYESFLHDFSRTFFKNDHI